MAELFVGTGLHALEVGARTIVRRRRYLSQARQGQASPAPAGVAAALGGLRKNGYFVVPGFYSAETCAGLRAEIDRIIQEQGDIVQLDEKRSDYRVHGAERASQPIRAFHEDPFCRGAGESYFDGALGNLGTLAARLTAIQGNLGSGQGWHRDALHFQYKAMVYLSDVGLENGPFQLLEGSHRPWNLLVDTIRGKLVDEPRDRITPEQVARIAGPAQKRLRTFTAKAGTLIVFDSSTIHRGSPIRSGTRYALTNYYYPVQHLTPAMYEHFAPFARATS
jgi:hypothetical protein